MAYLCTLASVPAESVSEIRGPADLRRVASKIVNASHYIVAAYPEIEEAMDGGTPLDTDTWHPLRGFMMHSTSEVPQHAVRLAALVKRADPLLKSDDFVRTELVKVLEIFEHAGLANEAVVTVLDLTRTGKR